MKFPWEDDLRRERSRFMTTIESLTDEEFEHGQTLCELWTPRDVLAHIIGTDRLLTYLNPRALTIDRGNAIMVRTGSALTRAELTERGWAAARTPSLLGRASAWLVLAGDCAMHHQDVLRGLGKPHELPDESGKVIFREALVWRVLHLKPLRHRIEPTTPGARPMGRGPKVSGTTEALSLWLAGRDSVTPELEFE